MGAFGLLDDHHHARVPRTLMCEASPRVDVWHLLQTGALVAAAVTDLEWDTVGGPPASRTVNVCSEGGNVTIDGIRVALAWDTPMADVERVWFVCPACGRRCRHVYLRNTIACRRCHGLDYASRHLRRQTPAVGRVERLRRRLGDCETKPFAPLPARVRRGRSRAYHDMLVAMIHGEEAKLLEHLGSVVHDLKRRIRVRKERGKW